MEESVENKYLEQIRKAEERMERNLFLAYLSGKVMDIVIVLFACCLFFGPLAIAHLKGKLLPFISFYVEALVVYFTIH